MFLYGIGYFPDYTRCKQKQQDPRRSFTIARNISGPASKQLHNLLRRRTKLTHRFRTESRTFALRCGL